jgi:SOS-response transcriptional repressor LexA
MDSLSPSSTGAIARSVKAQGGQRDAPSFRVPRRRALSEREKAALKFIRDFVRAHDYAPSFSELARFLGITSKSTAAKVVTRLQRRKLVERSGPIVRGRRFEGELRCTASGHIVSLQTQAEQ